MKITAEVVDYVAGLARLNLTEEDRMILTNDMGDIIEWVDKLNQLDTAGVEPATHVMPLNNVFREDIAKPSFDREDILENAPSKDEGCFKVPKVVE